MLYCSVPSFYVVCILLVHQDLKFFASVAKWYH